MRTPPKDRQPNPSEKMRLSKGMRVGIFAAVAGLCVGFMWGVGWEIEWLGVPVALGLGLTAASILRAN